MEQSEKFSIYCHRKIGNKVSPNEGLEVIKRLLKRLRNELPELFINDTLNVQTFSKKHRTWIKSDLSDYDLLMPPIIQRLVQKDYKAKDLAYDSNVKCPIGFTQGFVNIFGKEQLDDRVQLRVTQGFEGGFVNNTIHIKFNPFYYDRLSNLDQIQNLFTLLIDFWKPEQLFVAPFSMRQSFGETDLNVADSVPSLGWVTWFPEEPITLKSVDGFILKSFHGGTLLALSETAKLAFTQEEIETIGALRSHLGS